MNPALKALQDKFKATVTTAETLAAKTAPTQEDLDGYKAAVAEVTSLKTQIEDLARADTDLAAVKAWDHTALGLPKPGAPSTAVAAGSTAAGKTVIDLDTGEIAETGLGILSGPQMKATADPAYLKAFVPFLRAGGVMSNVKSVDARKALVEGIDTDGGQLVPAEIMAGILMRQPAAARLVDNINVVTVSSDRAMWLRSIYTVDDLYSSAVRVYKTAEGAAATVSDKPLFGTLTIDVHQFTAELSISRQLLEDSAFDILGFITNEFRTAKRNFSADKTLNGSGVGEHFGLLTRAGQAGKGPDIIKTGSAAAVTWNGLRTIKNAVPEQYDGNSKYYFNKKSTQDAIEALVDGNGRPLWPEQQRSGLESGVPGTLQGYSYVREARMPDVAANALPAIFGDALGYTQAMRLGMTIEALRELEARKGMVVLLCRFREGAEVTEPWRLRVLKCQA